MLIAARALPGAAGAILPLSLPSAHRRHEEAVAAGVDDLLPEPAEVHLPPRNAADITDVITATSPRNIDSRRAATDPRLPAQ